MDLEAVVLHRRERPPLVDDDVQLQVAAQAVPGAGEAEVGPGKLRETEQAAVEGRGAQVIEGQHGPPPRAKSLHTLTLRKRPWYRLRHVRHRPAANGEAHPRV